MDKTSWTYSIKLYMKYKMYDEDCLKFKMLRGGGNTTPPPLLGCPHYSLYIILFDIDV